jgi:general secretion pathway protein N
MAGRLVKLAVGLLVFIGVLAVSLPANWMARYVSWATHGTVLLADAQGSVWKGDAVLGLSANGVSRSLPGRVSWTTRFSLPSSLEIALANSDVLARPILLRVGPGETRIGGGDATVPLALAVLAGAPLNTVGPNGLLRLHWDPLTWQGGAVLGQGIVQILGLWVDINPVRPLGDYRVTWQYAPEGLTWTLATENGPLQLDAHGSGLDRARFSGRAGIAKGVPDATAQRLWPLLEALGPRQGDSVQITIGAY